MYIMVCHKFYMMWYIYIYIYVMVYIQIYPDTRCITSQEIEYDTQKSQIAWTDHIAYTSISSLLCGNQPTLNGSQFRWINVEVLQVVCKSNGIDCAGGAKAPNSCRQLWEAYYRWHNRYQIGCWFFYTTNLSKSIQKNILSPAYFNLLDDKHWVFCHPNQIS